MNGVANGDAANLALQGLTVQGSSGANSHDNKVVETSSDRLPRGKVRTITFKHQSITEVYLIVHCGYLFQNFIQIFGYGVDTGQTFSFENSVDPYQNIHCFS